MTIMWDELLHNGYGSVSEMLHDMYVVQRMTLSQIAEKLGVSKWAVRRQMVLHGIEIRPKPVLDGSWACQQASCQ